MKEPIQIWCDGSYRQGTGIIGLGWVRVGGGMREEGQITLPKLVGSENHGSDIAEYAAFARALEPLPAGSSVHVHMDCQNVAETLVKARISPKQMSQPALLRAFSEAVSAKQRMGTIAISYTSDRNPNMARAHELSRIASTPGKKAKAPGKKL